MSTRTRTLYDLAGSDIIDSRQLIARLRELEDQDGLAYARSLDEDEREELAALRAICEEGESFPDWKDGATLIRDSYLTTYAQELAEDIGAISSDAQWPLSYIDWERVAADLKSDYSIVEIEGYLYYVRA